MTPFPVHGFNYPWNEEQGQANLEDQDQVSDQTNSEGQFDETQNQFDLHDSLPDYETSLSHLRVVEENSFPHLMPFLESYKNNTTPVHSPYCSDPSLPVLPAALSRPSLGHSGQQPVVYPGPPLSGSSLPGNLIHQPSHIYPMTADSSYTTGRFSLPDIITPARSPPIIRTHTGSVYQSRSMVSTVSVIETNFESEEEEICDEEDEDGSDVEDGMEVQPKRRSAVGSLPVPDAANLPQKKNPLSNQPKKRQRTSPAQLEVLEKVYQQEKLPSSDLRKELAVKLRMTPRRVQVWFQNKRAKEKRLSIAK